MIERLIRFLNRPVLIVHAPPSRRVRAAFWWLLTLWLTVNAADLVTTVALLAAHASRPSGYHEANPVGAWALAHGGLAMLVVEKALYATAQGIGLRLLSLLQFPRLTLAAFALLSLPAAAAVLWNSRLLILR
jgi:hypothetical protein